jgi:hypothetical protein
LIGLLVGVALNCGGEPEPPEASDEMLEQLIEDGEMITLQKFRVELRKAGIWTGGPDPYFGNVGRNTLVTAIEHGLMREHKVLDVGAGSLRVGWWFLHYIEPRNYYAIEPVKERIDTAAGILGADINIYYNDDFEFPAVMFDFVIARSIWTHASKSMISKMLAEFAENSAPDAKFLTSVILAKSEEEDYKGDKWVGKVLKTDGSGMVAHSPEWIMEECKKYGLSFEMTGELYRQTWLLISRE